MEGERERIGSSLIEMSNEESSDSVEPFSIVVIFLALVAFSFCRAAAANDYFWSPQSGQECVILFTLIIIYVRFSFNSLTDALI